LTSFIALKRATGYNSKTKRLSGKHTSKEIEDDIKAFTDIYVLCPNCRLPELMYNMGKKRVHYMCKSCGSEGRIHAEERVESKLVDK
jgi:translation initiation factor 5